MTHYRSLYGMIEYVEKRIHYASSDGQSDTIAEIPVFHTDLPTYNALEITNELAQHFTDMGYYVRKVSARKLYISWRYPRKHVR